MTDTEQLLRDRLAGWADALPTGAPDLAGAQRTVRRQRRNRTATAVAGVAAVAVAGTAVGLTVTTGGGARSVRTAGVAADAPLPGLARIAAVTVPGDLQITSESAVDGQVWAVGVDPGTHTPSVLHAADGGTLTTVLTLPGAAVQVALLGGHALVVNQRELSGDAYSKAQVPTLRVYDATSAALVSSRPLLADRYASYGQAGLIPTAAGSGPLVLAVEPNLGSGGGPLRFGVLAAAGDVTLGAPVTQTDELHIGQPSRDGNGVVTLVTLTGGVPRYAYVADSTASVTRIDLRTGVEVGILTVPGEAPNGVPFTGADQEVGGRVLYTSERGLLAGAPDSTSPTFVAANDQLTFLDGRAYVGTGPDGQRTEQQLDPQTLQPTGPTATQAGQLVPDTGLRSIGLIRDTGTARVLTAYGSAA